MSILRKSIIFILILITYGPLHASSQVKPPQTTQRYGLTVNAPIYSSKEQRISLSVEIPKNYKALITAAEAAKLNYLKFIPKNDNLNAWTEMLTLQILTQEKMSALQYVKKLQAEFTEKYRNAELLQQINQSEEIYNISTLAYAYENNGKQEIIYMRYYSSQNHMSGLQFAKVFDKNINTKDALQGMVDYVNQISKVSVSRKGQRNLNVKFSY